MNNVIMIELENETAVTAWAASICQLFRPPLVIGLSGELGAGKTTLVRALLRGLGIQGAIKSPTYALVESYESHGLGFIHHFDLYRIMDEEELDLIGFRDYLSQDAVCFIEWPTKAASVMAVIDIMLDIAIQGEGRVMQLTAKTLLGKRLIDNLRG